MENAAYTRASYEGKGNKKIKNGDEKAFERLVNSNLRFVVSVAKQFQNQGFTKVVGTEARGFLFGAPLALALGIDFVPVRKPGKLTRDTFAQAYQLEYGEDVLEIHCDALTPQDKVLIIDDLLATGGTIEATTKLIRRVGASVEHAGFVISLPDLGGETRLEDMGVKPFSLVQYAGE